MKAKISNSRKITGGITTKTWLFEKKTENIHSNGNRRMIIHIFRDMAMKKSSNTISHCSGLFFCLNRKRKNKKQKTLLTTVRNIGPFIRMISAISCRKGRCSEIRKKIMGEIQRKKYEYDALNDSYWCNDVSFHSFAFFFNVQKEPGRRFKCAIWPMTSNEDGGWIFSGNTRFIISGG